MDASDISDKNSVDEYPNVIIAGKFKYHVLFNTRRINNFTIFRYRELRLDVSPEEIIVIRMA